MAVVEVGPRPTGRGRLGGRARAEQLCKEAKTRMTQYATEGRRIPGIWQQYGPNYDTLSKEMAKAQASLPKQTLADVRATPPAGSPAIMRPRGAGSFAAEVRASATAGRCVSAILLGVAWGLLWVTCGTCKHKRTSTASGCCRQHHDGTIFHPKHKHSMHYAHAQGRKRIARSSRQNGDIWHLEPNAPMHYAQAHTQSQEQQAASP